MMSKQKKQIKHKAGAYTLWLKPLPKGPLMMALSEEDRPEVPMIDRVYAGDVKVTEPNPQDPKYLNDLETWRAVYNSRLFRLCVVYGVDRVENAQGGEAKPTGEDLESVRFIYGNNISMFAARLYWLAELIGNTASGFINLVMGQSEVTEEGLAEAEDHFRGNHSGTGRGEGHESEPAEG